MYLRKPHWWAHVLRWWLHTGYLHFALILTFPSPPHSKLFQECMLDISEFILGQDSLKEQEIQNSHSCTAASPGFSIGNTCTKEESKPMNTVYYYMCLVPIPCLEFLALLNCAGGYKGLKPLTTCLLSKTKLKGIPLTLVGGRKKENLLVWSLTKDT